MNIKKIDFGSTHAGDEFSIDDIEKFEKTFLKDHYPFEFSDILKKNYQFIYGHKGTGKTSILKYFEIMAYENKIDNIFLSYSEITDEIEVIEKFSKLAKETENADVYILNFWYWYFLSIVAKTYNIVDENSNLLIFHSPSTFFKTMSSLLEMLGLKININNSNIDLSANFQPKNVLDATKKSDTEKISELTKLVHTHLNKKVLIFIDELELSKMSSTYHLDSLLITNLIKAVSKINKTSEKLVVITAIRTEVLKELTSLGREVMKIIENKSYEVEWQSYSHDINHPLIHMIIKKLKYSIEKEGIEKSKNKSNEEIFYTYFEKEFENSNTPKFILDNTWLKPRDVVRMLKAMQHVPENNYSKFNIDLYRKSYTKYIEKVYSELMEDLSTIYNENQLKCIERGFNDFQRNFTINNFITRFSKCAFDDDVLDILDNLFEIGIIGNQYKDETGKTNYSFYFRGERNLLRDRAIMVHRALWNKFNLSRFDSSIMNGYHTIEGNHIISQDKKYNVSYYSDMDDQDIVLTLQDRLNNF